MTEEQKNPKKKKLHLPKLMIHSLFEAHVHLQDAIDDIDNILISDLQNEICKYGEDNLIYYKVICNNALKGIAKICSKPHITKKKEQDDEQC